MYQNFVMCVSSNSVFPPWGTNILKKQPTDIDNFKLQWNPVNLVTTRQQKSDCIFNSKNKKISKKKVLTELLFESVALLNEVAVLTDVPL